MEEITLRQTGEAVDRRKAMACALDIYQKEFLSSQVLTRLEPLARFALEASRDVTAPPIYLRGGDMQALIDRCYLQSAKKSHERLADCTTLRGRIALNMLRADISPEGDVLTVECIEPFHEQPVLPSFYEEHLAKEARAQHSQMLRFSEPLCPQPPDTLPASA